ncbi:MAG: OmpA family protein [Actinomycetota bacterium]
MSAGWVCERVSTDHTVIPDLTPGRIIVPPPSPAPTSLGSDGPERSRWSGRAATVFAAWLGTTAALAGTAAFWFYGFEQTPEPEPPATLAMVDEPTQQIIVADGVVYLEGAVPSEEALRRLQEVAEEAVGSDRVVNNLEVRADAYFDETGPITLGVQDTVRFRTGRAEVREEYEPLIELTVRMLKTRPETSVTLVGHTDDRGTDELNLELSLARAEAVAAEFVRRGIDRDRLTVDGRGEEQPLVANDSPEGRSANRRVEFLVSGLLD